jgi:hypothetical protein
MRCGASGEPKTGFWSVYRSYCYVTRGKSIPQQPNNFGQAREKRQIRRSSTEQEGCSILADGRYALESQRSRHPSGTVARMRRVRHSHGTPIRQRGRRNAINLFPRRKNAAIISLLSDLRFERFCRAWRHGQKCAGRSGVRFLFPAPTESSIYNARLCGRCSFWHRKLGFSVPWHSLSVADVESAPPARRVYGLGFFSGAIQSLAYCSLRPSRTMRCMDSRRRMS